MKILALADVESKYLWDFFEKSKLEGIDLIISCGDLKPQYLSFLATFTHAPVLYVPGNHDSVYTTNPPEGCVNIDGKVYEFEGVRIMGLGGCMQYRPGEYMYSEYGMTRRMRKAQLLDAFKKGGIDIFVTHAPAFHLNDGDDLPHQGFQCFRKLLENKKPRYMIHGHVHQNYGGRFKRISKFGETTIINAYERYTFDYDEEYLKQMPQATGPEPKEQDQKEPEKTTKSR